MSSIKVFVKQDEMDGRTNTTDHTDHTLLIWIKKVLQKEKTDDRGRNETSINKTKQSKTKKILPKDLSYEKPKLSLKQLSDFMHQTPNGQSGKANSLILSQTCSHFIILYGYFLFIFNCQLDSTIDLENAHFSLLVLPLLFRTLCPNIYIPHSPQCHPKQAHGHTSLENSFCLTLPTDSMLK